MLFLKKLTAQRLSIALIVLFCCSAAMPGQAEKTDSCKMTELKKPVAVKKQVEKEQSSELEKKKKTKNVKTTATDSAYKERVHVFHTNVIGKI